MCVRCKEQGRITVATEVHHIQPRNERPDLTFERSNLLPLCSSCHEKEHSVQWPKELVVIVGPPGSGKTTESLKMFRPHVDLLWDLDVAAGTRERSPEALQKLLRMRDDVINEAAQCNARLIFISCRHEEAEQRASQLIVMNTPKDECKRRVRDRQLSARKTKELINEIDIWQPPVVRGVVGGHVGGGSAF